jgi:hypothetical protein
VVCIGSRCAVCMSAQASLCGVLAAQRKLADFSRFMNRPEARYECRFLSA